MTILYPQYKCKDTNFQKEEYALSIYRFRLSRSLMITSYIT